MVTWCSESDTCALQEVDTSCSGRAGSQAPDQDQTRTRTGVEPLRQRRAKTERLQAQVGEKSNPYRREDNRAFIGALVCKHVRCSFIMHEKLWAAINQPRPFETQHVRVSRAASVYHTVKIKSPRKLWTSRLHSTAQTLELGGSSSAVGRSSEFSF